MTRLPDKLYSPQELADYLGLSKSWVYKATASRSVPFVRLGKHIRFTEGHVAQILAMNEFTPPPARPTSRRQGRRSQL